MKKQKDKSKSERTNNKKQKSPSSPTNDKLRYVRLNGKIIDTRDKKFKEEVKREHDKSDHFQDKANVVNLKGEKMMVSEAVEKLRDYVNKLIETNQEKGTKQEALANQDGKEQSLKGTLSTDKIPSPEIIEKIKNRIDKIKDEVNDVVWDGNYDISNLEDAIKLAYKKGYEDGKRWRMGGMKLKEKK